MSAHDIIEVLKLLPADAPVYIATDSQGLLLVRRVTGYHCDAGSQLSKIDLVMDKNEKDYAGLISPFDA